jgi:hypothetical protein
MKAISLLLLTILTTTLALHTHRQWNAEVRIEINCTTHRGHTVCLAHSTSPE